MPFEYDSELYDGPMMARMAKHFPRILEAVVAAPERSISSIVLLEKDEWQRAVFGWNCTAREYRKARWQGLSAISAERPDDVALISDGQRISFGELAQRAELVATVLRGRAVSAAGPVAIFLPRSVEAFAAMLGCFIAGVPWVPLDTAQPDRRLVQLVSLAG